MASPATPCAASQLKVEEPEAATAQAAIPAEKIGKRPPGRAKAIASVATNKPAASSRVRKPAAKTPTGTKIRSKKLRLIAEAKNTATTASTTNNNSHNGDNYFNESSSSSNSSSNSSGSNNNSSSSNSNSSSNSSGSNNNSSSSNSNSSISNSSISNNNSSSNSISNNISNNRNNRSRTSEGMSPARAISGKHTSPPLPADAVFAKLPDDANPIDKAVFAQLALVWNEDAGRWTEAMRHSFLDILPRARVTKSTATLSNQYVCRIVRQNYAESGAIPTWGQFVVIRSMFGPAVCFRFKWAADFVKRYPLAREDSYEGAVPFQRQVVKDVMEGKVGMPVVARNRKEGIMQLGREKTRKTIPRAAGVKKENSEAGAAFSADLKMEAEGEDETFKVDEDVWNEAAASAGRMDPAMWLDKQRRMYADKQALVMKLQEDMRDIRKSLDAFKRMADVVMEG